MKRASMVLAVIAQLLVLQHAQAYPDRPIKLVVPSPAGSPPDQMARLVSDKMSANLGQPVIVDNRAGGAGGTVGAKSVVTAEPDGHTILLCSTSNLLIARRSSAWIQAHLFPTERRSGQNHLALGQADELAKLTAMVTRSLLSACVVLAGRNWLGRSEQNSSSHCYAKCRRPAAIHTLERPT
jgi:hypothetical protein